MKLIKLGAAALNQTPLDWEGNKQNIITAIDMAAKENVQVLCLPELCITGYGCEDSFHMPHVIEKAWSVFEEIQNYIKKYSNMTITVGLPFRLGPALYNCTIIFDCYNAAIIPKQNLCSDGIHYEGRWFKPWPQNERLVIDITTTFGDCIYQIGDIRIGVEICEDAWSADRPGSFLASKGVDIILNPSASHFSFGKNKIRERFVEEGSRAFRCAYVYSNLLGNESGRVIFDGDTYIASGGNIVSRGNRFSFKKVVLTTAVIDIDKNRVAQMQNGSLRPSITNGYGLKYKGIVEKEGGNLRPVERISYGPHYNLDSDFDSFTRAVALGLWDYMFKSRSKGFVLSLSGGADSAAVACLVRSMVICAYNELGDGPMWDQLIKLGVVDRPVPLVKEEVIKKAINSLLLCVYQGTENSSSATELAASKLSEAIGARFESIYIQKAVDEYLELVKQVLGRMPDWEHDDLAMQNIQARVRAPSVWMMANIRGSLLLSTSNRSEAAVGYATMDGDTCGGLSPIAGVSKTFILKWLDDYSTTHRNFEFFGLDGVLRLKPTAELRPQENEQTDESDLMPYPILNRIEEMVVKNKMSPADIVQTLSNDGIENPLGYVVKFFKLFTRNQWKRERYAPSFHLDDESLDPKTFYRFPILNSGFKEELEELLSKSMADALE